MIKILVIDDMKDNNLIVETILVQHFDDCRVSIAESGTRGIELAIKERPEIIILNIDISDLEGPDGYDICKILKGNPATSMIPVILSVDVESEANSYTRGLSLGADAFLRRPFSKEELIAQVKVVSRLKKNEDILRSNRHNIREELADSVNIYEELFNSVVDGIFVCDLKGRILEANRQGSAFFGQPKGAILNLKLLDYIEGDDIKRFIDSEKSDRLRVESRFLLPTGAFPVEISASLITFSGKRACFLIFRDISARKLEEQSRSDELNFLEMLVNSFGSAVIVIDESGLIRNCNKKGELFLGKERGPVVGARLSDLVADFDFYLNLFEKREAAERSLYLHRQHLKLDHLKGSSFDLSIFPLETVSGTAYRVLKIDDTANYRELDESSVKEQMMKSYSHFARGLAHDLNNILTGINTVVSLMRLDMERGEDVNLNEYLGTIEISGKRATDIVKQLRSIARREKLIFDRVELNRSIDNVVTVCKNSFDNSISIKVDFKLDNPLIEAELTGIERVILNICLNSAHAMTIMRQEGERWGGLLTIKTEPFYADSYFCLNHPDVEEKDYVRISISDTGVGMDGEHLAKVFEPFFTTKDKGQGRGLGLSVAYNIIRQHKGFIEIESQPGEGTVVNVYIPLYKNVGGRGERERTVELATGEGGVLLIESEELVRKLAVSILKKCGYNVFSSDSYSGGLELLDREREQIRLVLLDVSVPSKLDDGLLSRIKGDNRGIKLLITAGFIRDDRVEWYMEQGCDGFLEKPFNVRQLSNIVKETLEKS